MGRPVNTWAIPLLSAPSVVLGVAPAQSGVWPKLLETLAEGGPCRLRRGRGHYPVGRSLQYVLDYLATAFLDLLLYLPFHLYGELLG